MIKIKKQFNNGVVENLTFTFPEGTSHQVGTSYMQGNLVVVSVCLKITKDFERNDVILELPFDVKWAYGYIQQTTSAGVATTNAAHSNGNKIIADSNINMSNGAYPKVILTTWKA